MKCPRCQTINPVTKKFCRECGARILPSCPDCGAGVILGDKFCGECGRELEGFKEAEEVIPASQGERKHVTVLFSDLSGYTAMSERLDPEEVKSITTRIFGEVAQVIHKYEGFVEKYAGDAVMAIFGVPKAHEDDPVRAIRASREIHRLVKSMSPEIERKIEQPISMHTGINTGLVVTGEVNLEKGTHGVAGDAINVASRLSSAAGADEILVGQEVFRQGLGYFDFEAMGFIQAKGKSEPVLAYKVVAPREEPVALHGLAILRSELIGRKAEMENLIGAVKELREGKGSIFSICGDVGTGKSRLVEEFKAGLDNDEIQWLEGHAYAYCQNRPYFPLIDLFNRIFHVDEEVHPEDVREKVESGIGTLVEHHENIIPYIGSLYSLSYPDVENVSPEFWKAKLREAMKALLSALARKAPTVFFLEDLHWADPSFVELLRTTLPEIRQPAIVLCVYRPTFSLFTSHQLRGLEKVYREIRLRDLSSSEAQEMLASLLKSDQIPYELRRLVQDKAEGNPFYLEELVNSLIESETLIREDGKWKLTRPIRDADMSSTVHGIIAGRLDRLERESKRLLQEASVIGRSFLYKILKQVTEYKDQCDRCLIGLERLDLIRTKAVQPDLEYIFKDALTREVVYHGLLKKERQEIHERIGHVMERLFHKRLSEFYETLAFHFKEGKSVLKAGDYLMKSGEKSLKRYAVEESHQYFQEGFNLLSGKTGRTKEEDELLIDLMVKWALVFYYRGDFKGLVDLFSTYQNLAQSLEDKTKRGMFYCRLGWGLHCMERFREAYDYFGEALRIGEKMNDQNIIGYACAWLTWTCAEIGLLDKAIAYGKRTQEIYKSTRADHYLYFKSLAGMGQTYLYMGKRREASEAGQALLAFGQKHSNIRGTVMGHYVTGFAHLISGDYPLAIESFRRGVQVSADAFYTQMSRLFLGLCHFFNEELREAEEELGEVAGYSKDFGCEVLRTPAQAALYGIAIAKGHLSQGLKGVEECVHRFIENERRCCHAIFQHVLGNVYLAIVERKGPISLSTMAKNTGFLVENISFSDKKAEHHLNEAIKIATEIGAKGILGQAYLDLGLLHKARGSTDKARQCISKAIQFFEQCEAELYLKKAREALASSVE